MVNKSLFASMLGRMPKANAVNEAGGFAYKLEPKHALAQVAATITFGNGRVPRTVFQMIRSGQFKNKAGKGRVGLSNSVQRAFQRC